jgi:hypothetical protein
VTTPQGGQTVPSQPGVCVPTGCASPCLWANALWVEGVSLFPLDLLGFERAGPRGRASNAIPPFALAVTSQLRVAMNYLRKLNDYIHRHERIEESLRALWQVLAESRLLSTTISRTNAGFERWLLAFFGLRLHTETSAPLLTNGVSTREWKRRIQLASELEMPWDDSLREDQQRAAYMAHIGRVLDQFDHGNRKTLCPRRQRCQHGSHRSKPAFMREIVVDSKRDSASTCHSARRDSSMRSCLWM